MNISKYNIISDIKDSSEFFIVNLLSGHADILAENEVRSFMNGNYNDHPEFIEKGYVVNEADELKLYKQKYLEFIDNREKDEIQIFFVTTYACNFRCSYCYQSGYDNKPYPLKREVTDSFFSYISGKFAGKNKYITLFGGEPLLTGEKYKKELFYFLDQCKNYNIEVSIVTNGYYVMEYMEKLSQLNIREIQITLDGMPGVHNKRRYAIKGEDTFTKISEGIDLCLQNNIPVNLRVVLDKENIMGLPELAEYAIQKNWTENINFKTQLGRNYELHYCQSGNQKLFSRIELYEKIYSLIKKHPEILSFHRPAFSISNYLFENGKLPDPLFDACPGCKTEWAFDYTGAIFSCTATVGKEDEKLGTFYPHEFLNEEKVYEWENRDVLSIEKCKDCSVQLACGGGCASIAKNTCGNLLSPDCRPVKKLLEMGISLYK